MLQAVTWKTSSQFGNRNVSLYLKKSNKSGFVLVAFYVNITPFSFHKTTGTAWMCAIKNDIIKAYHRNGSQWSYH